MSRHVLQKGASLVSDRVVEVFQHRNHIFGHMVKEICAIEQFLTVFNFYDDLQLELLQVKEHDL